MDFTETKVCASCKDEKPIKKFNVDKSRKDGKCIYCQSCNSKLRHKWYLNKRRLHIGLAKGEQRL